MTTTAITATANLHDYNMILRGYICSTLDILVIGLYHAQCQSVSFKQEADWCSSRFKKYIYFYHHIKLKGHFQLLPFSAEQVPIMSLFSAIDKLYCTGFD